MPRFLMKRWHGYRLNILFVVMALFIGILTWYEWIIGTIGFLIVGVLVVSFLKAKAAFARDLEEYVTNLRARVDHAGEEAVAKLPVGILLYDKKLNIQWANSYMESFQTDLINESLETVSAEISEMIEKKVNEKVIRFHDAYIQVLIEPSERIIYFLDVTDKERAKEQYLETRTVVALIYLDNYEEVTQGLEDQVRSRLISQVTSLLNNWANEFEILLRRTSSDRFIAILNGKTLQMIEERRFTVIDEIREATAKEKVAITISMGVGAGEDSLRELGTLAQSSLDLALGRGGDQVAIKHKNGKVRFYGGKSNALEKRTRVRARVISHALRDFVLESEKILIMGHKNPDMDAIGAAIGVRKIAEVNGKDGYIILDPGDINPDVQKLLEEVKNHGDLWSHFITPEEAKALVTSQTLLIIVDTHKPSLVIEPKILDQVERIIVLDHHRRGEEFIEEPVLVYMEPYASSTAELVTELLEYQPKQLKMDRLESTALLAGIIVDTKSFAVRTGARTFDAASFLRSNGADTILVQKLLKEDLDQYVQRAGLVKSAEYYRGDLVIAAGDETESHSQVIIAQAADTLLTMKGVVASFVISKRQDGFVGISARSLGDVNVQLIMEHLGGGGHLTNAAAQLDDVSLEEAELLLKKAIDDCLEGGQ
ncbi:DHH family phosphoesterase [bacterium LRH843]|nr:DHH family phosphoesterase [bacterium LRH843]